MCICVSVASCVDVVMFVFFFKQKTAYEMRISDWSSDVCSSDLAGTLPADLATPDFVVERPKDRGHGDFSTNAAMLLARPARSNPRALAQALVDALPPNDDIAAVEIAEIGRAHV